MVVVVCMQLAVVWDVDVVVEDLVVVDVSVVTVVIV